MEQDEYVFREDYGVIVAGPSVLFLRIENNNRNSPFPRNDNNNRNSHSNEDNNDGSTKKKNEKEENLKRRRKRHYNEIMNDAGREDTGKTIIRYFAGDMWNGEFLYGIQKSKFKEVRDYGSKETIFAAVVKCTGVDGSRVDGDLILVEESRVYNKRQMFLKSSLSGAVRVVHALTGAISFSKSDNKKYQLVQTWTNGDREWKDSTELMNVCSEYGRAAQPTLLSNGNDLSTSEMTTSNKKRYKEMLYLWHFSAQMYTTTGMDFTKQAIPNSNNTIVTVSVPTIRQHIIEGDHAAAFAGVSTNWKNFRSDNISLSVLSFNNGYNNETGEWSEKVDSNQIKDMLLDPNKLSMKSKLQFTSMFHAFDLDLTYQKLTGRLEGKIRKLEEAGANFTTMMEMGRMRVAAQGTSQVNWKNTCPQCKVRKTRRKHDFCSSCRDANNLCVDCHRNKRRKPGGLCLSCFNAKGGERKNCVVCKVRLAKYASGECRTCRG